VPGFTNVGIRIDSLTFIHTRFMFFTGFYNTRREKSGDTALMRGEHRVHGTTKVELMHTSISLLRNGILGSVTRVGLEKDKRFIIFFVFVHKNGPFFRPARVIFSRTKKMLIATSFIIEGDFTILVNDAFAQMSALLSHYDDREYSKVIDRS
jgi:hypothetical protein